MKPNSISFAAFLHAIYISFSPASAQSSPGIHCSLQGYDGGVESFMSTTDRTYPGCSKACYQQSSCSMFAYAPPEPGSTKGDCQLYNTLTAKNWVRDDTSPYFFYDNGCETRISKCNYLGVNRDHNHIATADTSSLPASQRSLQACRTRCTTNPSCKSYAWTQTSCAFYDVPVSGNFLYGTGDQPVSSFYDLACTVATSSSTTKSTSTTAVSSTLKTTTKPQTTKTTTKIIVTSTRKG